MGGWVRYRLTSSNARLYSSVQLVTLAPLSVRKKGLDLHVKRAMNVPMQLGDPRSVATSYYLE